MKYPILVVGIGQCGGNIADVAEEKGFSALAINSYKGDLDSLQKVTIRKHLTGYNGAGKNRNNGKDALKDNLEEVVELIMKAASEEHIKVVTVAFSADGGTGSGGGPLLMEILTEVLPDKVINAIVVLPTSEDSIGSLANTTQCIDEISQIEHIGSCLFIDNDKVKDKIKGRKELYSHTNSQVIRLLKEVCIASSEASINGNFDEADMLSVFSSRGTMNISITHLAWKKEDYNLLVKQQIEAGILASPEYDQKLVNAAFIYRMSKPELIDKNAVLASIGTPLEIFEGHYTFPKGGQHVITVLSGMSFPFKRLHEMEEKIEKHKEKIETNITSSLSQKFESKSSWVDSMKSRRSSKVEKPKESISDKLKKFK